MKKLTIQQLEVLNTTKRCLKANYENAYILIKIYYLSLNKSPTAKSNYYKNKTWSEKGTFLTYLNTELVW